MTCLPIVALTLCVVLTLSASVDSCGFCQDQALHLLSSLPPLSSVHQCDYVAHLPDGCLRFASYYGEHMVLQRSPERAVMWGYGPDGGHVTVSLSGPVNQKTSPVPVIEGVWQVTMNPVDAGGPYNVTAATEGSTATLTDF
ncbi:unnamed protein product [Pleuronectes platessa]|uniref:Secreted protein n=1 Tax=Pleuronectes platessa TaxID=8262 RepID=A0A9N7UJ23_PLEPL|nr:unnamed protein product [Pleuronectes platessa]